MGFSRDDVVALPDDQVEYELIKALIPLATSGDRDEQYQRVTAMSPGLQMLWATWVLDGEVNNGGFNQYFFNNSGSSHWRRSRASA